MAIHRLLSMGAWPYSSPACSAAAGGTIARRDIDIQPRHRRRD